MEFPDDVLGIIRAYARPCMQFIHEYNEIVRVLGEPWHTVKVKLATSDAEKVIVQFASYADSVVIVREAKDSMPVLTQTCASTVRWLLASRVYKIHLEVSNERRNKLQNLLK